MSKDYIVKIMHSIPGNVYSVYSDWIKICALSILNSVIHSNENEVQYLSIIKKYREKDLKSFIEAFSILQILMEEKYDDYLGSIYMTLETNSKRTGQFFTPFHISKMISEFTDNKNQEGRELILEPSCGAGSNIIAFIEKEYQKGINYQERYEIIAQDLDWNCVYMCYIQMSLYGVYGKVIQGDSLSENSIKNVLYTPNYIFQRGGINVG